jgi:hypothetical protein
MKLSTVMVEVNIISMELSISEEMITISILINY